MTHDLPEADIYSSLYRQWQMLIPYSRAPETPANVDYPQYREERFRRFLQQVTRELPDERYQLWLQQIDAAEKESLSAYQKQMSILAYLEPGAYREQRIPIPIEKAHIALIHKDAYYLVPICEPGTEEPIRVEHVINYIVALLRIKHDDTPDSLKEFTHIKRSHLPELDHQLRPKTRQLLERLQICPIIINFDTPSSDAPLAKLRQAERGVGSHALTIFDAGQTMIFDQSHVFYDGAWGAAFAEIMTNEALSWAVYLRDVPLDRFNPAPPRRLEIVFSKDEKAAISNAPKAAREAWAETESVNTNAIMGLRKLIKRRSDLIKLTVNDLLLLYRALHASTYQPTQSLVTALQMLATRPATRHLVMDLARSLEENKRINPSMLIPVDASLRRPFERVQPLSFEVPLQELDLFKLHRDTLEALNEYERGTGSRDQAYARFDTLQRTYLVTIAGFGEVLN